MNTPRHDFFLPLFSIFPEPLTSSRSTSIVKNLKAVNIPIVLVDAFQVDLSEAEIEKYHEIRLIQKWLCPRRSYKPGDEAGSGQAALVTPSPTSARQCKFEFCSTGSPAESRELAAVALNDRTAYG